MDASSFADEPAGLRQGPPLGAGRSAGVNVVLAVVKILAGVFGHSYALIADGIESSLDIVSSLVIWGGLKYAAKEPDPDHPYGHGKAEPISALMVSTALSGAALFPGGVERPGNPLPHPPDALGHWV